MIRFIAFAMAIACVSVLGCDRDAKVCPNGAAAEITGNHGHSLDIPSEHLARRVGGTYPVRGGDHEHAAPVKDADMAALARGESITTRTTSVNGHGHEVVLRCRP